MPVVFSEPEIRPLGELDNSRRRMITPSDMVRGDHWLPRGYDQGSTDYWDSKALPLWIDDIVEHTIDAGVNIEGILMKDTTITIPIMTQGSILFLGSGGLVKEDNTNFFWDDATDSLGIGTNSPNADMEVKATDTEIRVTDETHDYYSRIVRSDTSTIRYAQARTFIGIGNALDCPIQTTYFDSTFTMGDDLGPTDWEDFTVMFWAKPEFTVTEVGNVTGAGRQNDEGRFSVGFSGATDLWTVYIGGAGVTTFPGVNNAWVHFAIVFNSATGVGESYLDGVLADTYNFGDQDPFFQHLPLVENLHVGATNVGGATGKWKGLIDEFRIYNTQVPVADILDHVNNLTYELPAGPLLGYHLDDDLLDWAGTYDGTSGVNIGYDTGKVLLPSWDEMVVWRADSGILVGESALLTFGNDTSRTIIDGKTIRFNIAGTEYATFDTSGYFNVDVINEYTLNAGVTIDGVLIKDSTVTAGTLTMAAGSITDTSGTIDFGNEILKTTGVIQAGDFAKTGWPTTPGVTLSFDNGNLRLTVIDGGSAYYYVDGVKYVLGGNKTVDITDTEGLWYFYFVGSTLTASQVVWDFTAEDKALGAYIYWDATNNKEITLGYELHNFIMDGSTHGRMHFGGGSAWDSGLLVSDAGAEDVNVDAGVILDEDIMVAITDGAGAGLFEQVLSPAELPIYYRSGASDWRIYETANKANATDAGYVDGANDLHYNKLNGVWASTAAGVGKYVAYYAIASNDQTEPVALIMGQRTDTTLANAKDNNIFSGLSLSGLPFEEMVILARLILKQTAGGLFYTLEDIADLRAFNAQGNVTSPLITDHGGLGGLGDDDHAQYWIAGTVRTGNFATTGTLGIGTSTPDRAVEILNAANPQLRLTQADAAQYVDFQVDGGSSLIITSIANQIMKIDVTPLHNVAIGKDAGTNFTTGSFNVAVGRGTMIATTEGSNNTAIGALCFITNTTGYANSALGVSSLYGNTTGYSNTGLGVSALYTNTIGRENTSVGAASLYFNTEGNSNLAFGFEALRGNTTASNNTAVGTNALRSNTIGTVNSAFGLNSLYANIDGDYNVGIGTNALRFNTAGNLNVALGYAAGYYETGSNKLFIDNALRINEADGRVKALVYGVFAAATANQYFTVNGNFDVLENVALHGYVDLDEIAAPANPAANVGRMYVRDNAGTTTPYFLDSAGVETSMIAAGGLIPHKDTHDPEDGADPLDTVAAGAIQPDDASATGTSHSFARADHVHQIDCDTPNAIAGVQAGAEGTATYFARSDHDHAISHNIADNSLVTMDDAGPAAAGEYARFTASGLEGRTAAEVLSDIGGGGFTWIQKAAAYTAVDLDGILLDSTGGIFTITLPLNPVGGESIAFVDAGSACGTNNVTIARNGENIQGNAGDLIIDFDDAAFVLVFDATYGWRLDPFFATGSPTFLSDADGDTLVQVEQGADDDTIRFTAGGVAVATMVATAIKFTQDVTPTAPAGNNLGTAGLFWNDVSYKTLTDRGCLGSFDDGVEMQDESLVSCLEAIKRIGVASESLTVYGRPRLDYSTMPKAVYKPAPWKDGEKAGEDGAETTALISIMMGAIKELEQRLGLVEGI